MNQRVVTACFVICGVVLGCEHPRYRQPTSVALEPQYTDGAPIHRIPSGRVFLSIDDLIIENNFQVFLRYDAPVSSEPPADKPFLVVYKADDKYFVITYGVKKFAPSKVLPARLSIEKIVVVPNRDNWKDDDFDTVLKREKPLTRDMVVRE